MSRFGTSWTFLDVIEIVIDQCPDLSWLVTQSTPISFFGVQTPVEKAE
jgi:hypothetical protein